MAAGENSHYSGGGEKTVIKSVILRKYLWSYLSIMKKNWPGKNWYVDTHAGTGFSSEMGVEIPGSVVRALREDFDRYYLYEHDDDHFDTLVQTIEEETGTTLIRGTLQDHPDGVPVAHADAPRIRVMNMDCNEGVQWLAENGRDYSHWFTFVDPEGFSVERELMESLRDRGNMDILFNFQTSAYHRNSDENADGAETAESQLGAGFPRDASMDELVKWYEDEMFRSHDWNAKARAMVSSGDNDWRYDLIFASQNGTAMNIIGDIYNSDLKNDVLEEIERARTERGSAQQGFSDFDVHDPDERARPDDHRLGDF